MSLDLLVQSPAASLEELDALLHSPDLGVAMVTIDCDGAAYLLERLDPNIRSASAAAISKYVEDMRDGSWHDGSPMDFGPGYVISGQKRLQAQVATLTTQTYAVCHGRDAASADTTDTAQTRTLANSLQYRGEKYVATLAPLLVKLHVYRKFRTLVVVGSRQPSKAQCLRLLEEYPEALRDAARQGHAFSALCGIPPSYCAPLWYLFGLADEDDRDAFFESLSTGLGMESATDPIYRLRKQLANERAKSRSRQVGAEFKAAWTVKAWNAWRRGEEVKVFKWIPGGAKPEPFPRIDGLG